MNITVNAGHFPGLDSGAVGVTGLQEANVTKEVAELVAGHLRNIGHNVNLSQFNELYEITNDSNDFNSDIFVSIHCNAAESRSAKGTETFYASAEGQRLAQCIQDRIVSSMNTVNRGVKPCNFYVVRNTNAVSVLVELAFISNEDDEALLAENYDGFSRAVACGISDFAL